MAESPFISIVMPLYNKRPYVKRAVNSVLGQSFTDFELIIVDDGSTDGSAAEIPGNEKKIKLIRQQNNGPSIARNRGIQESSGHFVTFLDADDYYYENKLEKNANLLLAHPGVEWLVSAFDLQIGDEKYCRPISDLTGDSFSGEPAVVNNALLELDLSGIHINGLCISKSLIWSSLNGFRENIHCFEITDLLIRCALARPTGLIDPASLYRVVDVPDSAFKSSEKKTHGAQHMSQLYRRLSSDLEQTMVHYRQKGVVMSYSHVRGLIQSQKKKEALQYLRHSFPYKKNRKWLKFYLLCLMPDWFS